MEGQLHLHTVSFTQSYSCPGTMLFAYAALSFMVTQGNKGEVITPA